MLTRMMGMVLAAMVMAVMTRMAVLVLPFRGIRNPNNEDDEVGDGYQEPEQMGRAKGLALRGVRVERGVSGELIPRQCYICVAIGLFFVSVLHLCSNCTLARVLLFYTVSFPYL